MSYISLKTILISAVAAAVCQSVGASERTDTLLNASTASRITIAAELPKVAITVNRVDSTADNFYYEANLPSAKSQGPSTLYSSSDVRNIRVMETEDSVMVDFQDNVGTSLKYVYPLPDAANRSVKNWIGTRGSDFGFPIAQRGKTRYEVVSSGISFGWVGSLGAPAGTNPSMKRSHEYSWNMIAGFRVSRNNHAFTVGLGIRFRDIQTSGPQLFAKNDKGEIEMRPYEEGSEKHMSRIDLFNLQVPMTYNLRFGHRRNWALQLGPIVNFNTGASIKTQYTIGDRDYTVKTRDIHPIPVTVDLFAAIGFQDAGMYVRYSPMNVLRSRAALDFNTISTGFMFFF